MRQSIKIISCIAVIALSAVRVSAYDNRDSLVTNHRLFSNAFIQTGAGISTTSFANQNFNGNLNFTFDAALGKWFTPYVGVRLGYQGFNFTDWETGDLLIPDVNKTLGIHDGQEMYCVKMDYSYLHADLLWNPFNQFMGYKSYRFFDLIPYAHIGYEFLYNGYAGPLLHKMDVSGGAGLIGSFRVSNRLSAFVDLRAALVVRHTNVVGNPSYRLSSTFGVTYDFMDPTWQKVGKNDHTGYAFSRFIDNTFIGIGAGLTNYVIPHENAGWNAIAQPVGDFYIGKWFSPMFGARLGFAANKMSYWSDTMEYGKVQYTPGYFAGRDMYRGDFMFYNVHGDLLWNATNSFGGYDRSGRFDLIPYVSFNAGMHAQLGTNDVYRRDYFAGLGLLTNLKITDHIGINLDLRGDIIHDRIYGTNNTHQAFIVNGLIGTSYTFGNTGWNTYRPRVQSHKDRDEKPSPEGFILNSHFFDNSFVTLRSGVNSSWTPASGMGFNGRVTPAMDLAFGKMLTPGFGIRVGVGGSEISHFGNEAISGTSSYVDGDGKTVMTAGYLHPHVDALFDMMNLIGGYKPDRFYTVMAAPHIGYAALFSQENAEVRKIDQGLGLGFGIGNKLSISDRIDIDLNLDWTAAQVSLEKSAPFTHILTADVGLSYNFGRTSWIHSTNREYDEFFKARKGEHNVSGYIISNKFFDNTFITFLAGVNMFSDGSLGYGYNARPALGTDIAIGKWIVPYFALRLGYQGRNISEWGNNPQDQTYSYAGTFNGQELKRESVGYNYFHIDFVTDLMNDLLGCNAHRIYSCSPYASAGFVNLNASNGDKIVTTMGLGGGIINSFNIAPHFAIDVDLRAVKTFGSLIDKNSTGSGMVLSGLAGVTYKFGNTGWSTSVNEVPELSEKDKLEQKTRRWAVSTNLLGYVDLGTINVEAQYALSRHITFDMKLKSNAWKFNGKDGNENIMDKKSLANLGVKYWPWYAYSGLWFKGGLQIADYAVNGIFKNKTAERGDCYGLEVAGGYSIIICPWLNIDLGLGLWGGYRDLRRYNTAQFVDMQYQSGDGFFGVSDASVSLMFVF